MRTSGADLLWLAVEATEARLRTLFPDTWVEQHAAWAAIDAARVHTATDPRTSRARLCALNAPVTGSSAAA